MFAGKEILTDEKSAVTELVTVFTIHFPTNEQWIGQKQAGQATTLPLLK